MEDAKRLFRKFKEKINQAYETVLGAFIRKLFTKPASILFLGIDNAGKTTLVNKLKKEVNETLLPTHHPRKDTITIGNLKAEILDIGGHDAIRHFWGKYFTNVDGIVFIVDVHDDDRYHTVREAYQTVRELEKKAPIAVLMNKIDLLNMTSEMALHDHEFTDSICKATGIYDEPGTNNTQPVKVSFVSITHENNESLNGPLGESFVWLEKMISRSNNKDNSL